MVICHCLAVTDSAVCAAIRAGARDVGSLADCCGAGSGCGGCWPALQELLATVDAGPGMSGLAAAARS